VSVGGESRLRGFPSNAFTGKDFALYSLEFRSRPLYIASLALGGAVFYEAGDVFSGLSKLRPKQSAGFGFRLLIPQFNRIVFRGDIGFALSRPLPDGTKAYGLFFGFEQAFGFGTAAP
jgi:outer membrane protein assembly factor BamA